MNQILESVLKVAESVAVTVVPGANVIDSVVRDIVAHKNVVDEVPDLSKAVIQVIEQIGSHDIADEDMFQAGVARLSDGFKLVASSLKHKDGQPAPVPPSV